jgi:rhodanese-related sulfurtransferase
MEITAEELLALGDAGATIMNVGKQSGSREIRGAVRYRPHDLLTSERLSLPIPVEKPVVLYDESGNEKQTAEIAQKLTAAGFDARILSGGFAAWEKAGGATQEASFEQIVPPTEPSEVQELDRRL